MKAIYLIRYGDPSEAFTIRESDLPSPAPNKVLIKVDFFGLNFADVMARRGLYKAAPPIPSVLGYEVAGTIVGKGKEVTEFHTGQNVVAFTRFGGYAEYVTTDWRAVSPVPEAVKMEEAVALPTQYGTAYYCAYDVANIKEGEHVLIHAAAGGVGIALTQLAKRRKGVVYGTVSSDRKFDVLKQQGVDFPINYLEENYVDKILRIRGEKKLDVVFNPIGGKSFKQDRKLLSSGGRLIGYGASDRLNRKKNWLATGKLLFDFGFLHPVGLLASSITVAGVNMLRLADQKPEILQRCLQQVVKLTENNELKPVVGGLFPAEKIAEAHEKLENRSSVGKIVMKW
jgi:NADPH:quinone reductase-like Zn-dependent oxidoreductase